MPEAFSPNNDSRNDVIHPMIFCDFMLEEYHIYDRWGQEVFVSSSSIGGWDGNRDGNAADVGTYYYVIIGKRTSNGEKIMTKGNFLLLR
jgi:gliding motility-associated-like protein